MLGVSPSVSGGAHALHPGLSTPAQLRAQTRVHAAQLKGLGRTGRLAPWNWAALGAGFWTR